MLVGMIAVFITLSSRVHVFLSGDPVTQFAPEVVALLSGQGIQAYNIDPFRGPLFTTLVAGVAWLLRGDVFVAGQVVEVAAYALFILATFGAVRAAYGARLAFMTAASVATCLAVVSTGLAWSTDILFAALSVLSLWFMGALGRRWLWAALAAGLLAGLVLDTRWNGVFLLGVAPLAAVLNPWRARPRQIALWLGLFAGGFLIAALPWLAINAAIHGSPFYMRLLAGVLEDTLITPGLGPAPSLRDLVLANPAFFFPRYLRRVTWNEWLQVITIAPPLLAIFIPAGAVMLLRGLDRRKLLLGYAAIYWCMAVLTHYEARYFFPMLPLLMALPWLFLLSDLVPDWRWGGRLSLKLCLAVVALTLIGANQFQMAGAQSAGTEAAFEPQIEVAKLLANPPPGAVAGTKVALETYSGARYFIPHYSGLPVSTLKPQTPISALRRIFRTSWWKKAFRDLTCRLCCWNR